MTLSCRLRSCSRSGANWAIIAVSLQYPTQKGNYAYMPRNLSYDLACPRFQSFTVSTALVGLYRTERRGQHPGFTAVLVIMAQLGPVTCHHNRDLLVSIGASPAIHGIIAFHSCKVVSKHAGSKKSRTAKLASHQVTPNLMIISERVIVILCSSIIRRFTLLFYAHHCQPLQR